MRTVLRAGAPAVAGLCGVVVAGAGVAAGAEGAIAGARYLGLTSQQQPTVIVVGSSGLRITGLLTSVKYDAVCGPARGATYARYTIRAGGSFAINAGVFRLTVDATSSRQPLIPVIVAGRFDGRVVRGTIAATGPRSHCPAPRRIHNPYRATFSATGSPGPGP